MRDKQKRTQTPRSEDGKRQRQRTPDLERRKRKATDAATEKQITQSQVKERSTKADDRKASLAKYAKLTQKAYKKIQEKYNKQAEDETAEWNKDVAHERQTKTDTDTQE